MAVLSVFVKVHDLIWDTSLSLCGSSEFRLMLLQENRNGFFVTGTISRYRDEREMKFCFMSWYQGTFHEGCNP